MKHIFLKFHIPFVCLLFSTLNAIEVRNNIKPAMLVYNFSKISISPQLFKLQVNGSELKPGSSLLLFNDQKQITVRYDYKFKKGWITRTGAKEITFELDPQKKECNLEFSWDNQWRITASGAQPKKVKRVDYQF